MNKMLPKMSIEEKESLDSLLHSNTWNTVIKVMEHLAKDQSEAVLTMNLDEGPERLVILKARCEGAEKLLTKIRRLKSELKRKGEKE